MTEQSDRDGALHTLPAYPVIQQQLIDARDQLDHEVTRLTRMHAFNARVLNLTTDAEFIPAVGEAIVDIFELEFGICWQLDAAGALCVPIGVLGIKVDSDTLLGLGQRLLSLTAQTQATHATILTQELLAELSALHLIDQAICAPCLDSQGKIRALLLGGNTVSGATIFGSITPELGGIVDLFAQQLGALIENRSGRATINHQMAELQVAHQKLRLAVEVAQVVIWELDFSNQRLSFDHAMLPVLGLEPDETLTNLQDWIERVHSDDIGQFMGQFQAAQQPGNPVFDFEYRLRGNNGQYQWVHTKGRVIQRDKAGQPTFAVGTSMNTSARKEFEAELKQHRTHLEELVQQRTDELLATEARASRILDSAADGLYGIDTSGRVTFINPAGCKMLGYHADQVIGRPAHALFHHSKPDGSPYPVATCPSHDAMSTGLEIRVDNETYWHADGHPIPVMYAIHPIVKEGRSTGAVISFVDMSVQHAAALAREHALVAAENLARTRREFLANMSHEIRTPMNGVLGFAQIGYRHYQNSEKARNAFEKILVSGQRLLAVVDEILDFSKIESGKLRIEAVEMSPAEAIDHALELVADRARAKGIELRLDVAPDFPERCISDPLRIGQVLLNLLTNAIKFTEVGRITLSASRRGTELVFKVADTGIGIGAEQLNCIFDPFQQADGSTSRKFGGTGLGLAICKHILALMKGSIRVESTPGVGSLFEFRLPYVQPANAAKVLTEDACPDTHQKQPLAGISILVAEDDETNQIVMETMLVEGGAQVVMVGNGREAVERVLTDGPDAFDIVLMDIQMPEMNGYEATRLILELAPNLPIVGQTAHAFGEDRDKCLAAGMVAHVAKPIVSNELVKLVRQLVPIKHGR